MPVRDSTQVKLKCLENVQFDEPIQQGGKKKDDRAFVESLRLQVTTGRSLSTAQLTVLNSITRKYASQIPNFKELESEMELDNAKQPIDPNTVRLVEIMKNVTTWNPPVKRGNRKWSDQAFYESLANQFANRGALSPKQVASLCKMISKYAEQIPEYEKIAGELDLPKKQQKSS